MSRVNGKAPPKRTECNGCGACCDPVVLPFGPEALDEVEGLEASMDPREVEWLRNELEATDAPGWVAAGPAVQAFVDFGDGPVAMPARYFRCSNYEPVSRQCMRYEDRPPVCRGYPWMGGRPQQGVALPPSCDFLRLLAGHRWDAGTGRCADRARWRMNAPKALTLWQPWASLVPLGVKRIETRGWSTRYRGWLLIHAAKRRPTLSGISGFGIYHQRDAVRMLRATDGQWFPLPLGAVVAVARLVDVCPVGGPHDFRTGSVEGDEGDYPGQDVIVHTPNMGEFGPASLVIDHHGGGVEDISDQLPFGDFTPGRYGWVLDDIRALPEPIPAKGRQGLWTPAPDLVASAFACVGLVD